MKAILITGKLYDQIKAFADSEDEMIEVAACFFIKTGMKEMHKLDDLKEECERLKAETELTEAMLESKQDTRRH